jgi:hypothetical protein
MSVCIATTSARLQGFEEETLVIGISSARQVVPLIHFCYLIIFFIITVQCISLILMRPIGHPSLFILFTLFTPESLG